MDEFEQRRRSFLFSLGISVATKSCRKAIIAAQAAARLLLCSGSRLQHEYRVHNGCASGWRCSLPACSAFVASSCVLSFTLLENAFSTSN